MLTKKYWQDKDVALLVGKTLRTGVLCAMSTTIVGGLIYLFHNSKNIPDYHVFKGADPTLRHLPGILDGVIHLNGMAIIQLGVAILIATPVIRVMLSAIGFLIERDYMYVLITLVVLGIIMFNMLSGLGG